MLASLAARIEVFTVAKFWDLDLDLRDTNHQPTNLGLASLASRDALRAMCSLRSLRALNLYSLRSHLLASLASRVVLASLAARIELFNFEILGFGFRFA